MLYNHDFDRIWTTQSIISLADAFAGERPAY